MSSPIAISSDDLLRHPDLSVDAVRKRLASWSISKPSFFASGTDLPCVNDLLRVIAFHRAPAKRLHAIQSMLEGCEPSGKVANLLNQVIAQAQKQFPKKVGELHGGGPIGQQLSGILTVFDGKILAIQEKYCIVFQSCKPPPNPGKPQKTPP